MNLIKIIILYLSIILYFNNSAMSFDNDCINSNDFPFCLYEKSQIIFKILRYEIDEEDDEKEEVGWHKVEFHKTNNGYKVLTSGYVEVPYLLLLDYEFQYYAKGLWINHTLQKYEGYVDDDGDEFKIIIEKISDKELKITNKEGETNISKISFPSVHWNPEEIESNSIINLLTGEIVDINISKINENTWYIDGEIKYYITYDKSGRWKGLKFKPDEDSIMEYICTNCN